MPTNPANDAAMVAGALSRLGFDVVEKHDLRVAEMWGALRAMIAGGGKPGLRPENARSSVALTC